MGKSTFHIFIEKGLRLVWLDFPARALAKTRASKRGKYTCECCGKVGLSGKGIRVDHIEPVIDPVEGFKNWDTYIKRLFCDAGGLMIMCIKCHNKKTKAENIIRRQNYYGK